MVSEREVRWCGGWEALCYPAGLRGEIHGAASNPPSCLILEAFSCNTDAHLSPSGS